MIHGLSKVNIELSSVCQKGCWMCGRRLRDREQGDQEYGFMDRDILVSIPPQIPPRTLVAFHNNGESLMYPDFGKALSMFKHCITYTVTNGLLLAEKASEIISNIDVISVSIIEGEDFGMRQFQKEQILKFLELKGTKRPRVVLRLVGIIENEIEYLNMNLPTVRRTVHRPEGSRDYRKEPTKPEHYICQDLLTTLAIDRHGDVSVCVRYDVDRDLVLGNLKYQSLDDIWNCQKRLYMINKHIEGRRCDVKYCGDKCDFYGVATAP